MNSHAPTPAPPASTLADEIAATFRGSRSRALVLTADTVFYRAGTRGRPFGQFLSTDKPVSVMQTRIDKAIPVVWSNGTPAPLDTGFAIRIPRGTVVYSGDVASQGGIYVGGTNQIFVSQPWTIPGAAIVDSWTLR
ncbi:hypothetical protein [Ornithinimicrobium sp. LYQ103]|uniref:hypothetical protein n=1 Tax=Ornithinimicrobium sp. LYQ103 TaxID=3378796 RepID=UPI0038523F40